MALNTIMGINFKANINDLISGVTAARREMKTLNSKYKEMDSSMEDLADSTAKLELKRAKLNDALIIENRTLELKQGLLDKTTKKQGANSEAAKAAAAAVMDQRAKINKLNNDLKKINIQIESGTKAFDEQGNGLSLLGAKIEKTIAHIAMLNAENEEGVNDQKILIAEVEKANLVRTQEETKLKSLQAALEKTKESYGENSVEVMKAQTAVYQQQTVVANATKTFNNAKKALNDYNEENKEAKTILDRMRKAWKNTAQAMKEASDAIDPLSDGFTVLKGAMSHLVAHISASLFGTLKALLGNARELRKELAMLNATAMELELNTSELQKAEDAIKRVYSVTENTAGATEALNNLLTAGFKGNALDEVTDLLLGASIKWKDTLSMEGLGDSIQEAIGSQGMSVTGQFAELLERMGYDLKDWTKDFASLTTDAERQAKIVEALSKDNSLAQTLKLYQSDEVGGKLIKENEEIYETLRTSAQMAEWLNPIIIAVRKNLNELFLKAIDYVEELGGQEVIVEWINKVFDAAAALFDVVKSNLPLIATVLGVLTTGFAGTKIAAGIKGITTGFTEAAGAAKGFTGIMKGLGGVLKMNIFSIIAIAVVALVAALVHLYKTNEDVRNTLNGIFEAFKPILETLKEVAQALLPPLKTLIESLLDVLASVLQIVLPILQVFIELIAYKLTHALQIVSGALQVFIGGVNFAIGIFRTIIDVIVAVVQSIVAIVTGNFDQLGEIWSNFGTKTKEMWANLWQGLKDGFVNGFKTIWKSYTESFQKLIDWFKNLFGIHSPSKVMDGFGKNIMEGLINGIQGLFGGIKDVISKIVNFFTDLPSRVADKVKDVGSRIKDAFTSAVTSMKDIGKNIVSGLWNGINDKADWLGKKITGFASNAGQAIKDFFGIESPSKWAIEQGGMIGLGFGKGIANSAEDALVGVKSFNNKLSGGFAVQPNAATTAATTHQVVNAGLTVNYNGKLSRKQLYQLEKDNYTAMKMKLRSEGLV